MDDQAPEARDEHRGRQAPLNLTLPERPKPRRRRPAGLFGESRRSPYKPFTWTLSPMRPVAPPGFGSEIRAV